jgi:4-amino-4-deoxy-L-arabinose transferase-like glycosyltransferase
MRKYLKIAVTALSLAACLALVGLWARSYWINDFATGPFRTSYQVGFSSIAGRLSAVIDDDSINPYVEEWVIWTYPPTAVKRTPHWYVKLAFGSDFGSGVTVPHWFPALIFATIAAAPWLHWRRFTVRRLLIATAIVAAILGLAVATN